MIKPYLRRIEEGYEDGHVVEVLPQQRVKLYAAPKPVGAVKRLFSETAQAEERTLVAIIQNLGERVIFAANPQAESQVALSYPDCREFPGGAELRIAQGKALLTYNPREVEGPRLEAQISLLSTELSQVEKASPAAEMLSTQLRDARIHLSALPEQIAKDADPGASYGLAPGTKITIQGKSTNIQFVYQAEEAPNGRNGNDEPVEHIGRYRPYGLEVERIKLQQGCILDILSKLDASGEKPAYQQKGVIVSPTDFCDIKAKDGTRLARIAKSNDGHRIVPSAGAVKINDSAVEGFVDLNPEDIIRVSGKKVDVLLRYRPGFVDPTEWKSGKFPFPAFGLEFFMQSREEQEAQDRAEAMAPSFEGRKFGIAIGSVALGLAALLLASRYFPSIPIDRWLYSSQNSRQEKPVEKDPREETKERNLEFIAGVNEFERRGSVVTMPKGNYTVYVVTDLHSDFEAFQDILRKHGLEQRAREGDKVVFLGDFSDTKYVIQIRDGKLMEVPYAEIGGDVKIMRYLMEWKERLREAGFDPNNVIPVMGNHEWQAVQYYRAVTAIARDQDIPFQDALQAILEGRVQVRRHGRLSLEDIEHNARLILTAPEIPVPKQEFLGFFEEHAAKMRITIPEYASRVREGKVQLSDKDGNRIPPEAIFQSDAFYTSLDLSNFDLVTRMTPEILEFLEQLPVGIVMENGVVAFHGFAPEALESLAARNPNATQVYATLWDRRGIWDQSGVLLNGHTSLDDAVEDGGIMQNGVAILGMDRIIFASGIHATDPETKGIDPELQRIIRIDAEKGYETASDFQEGIEILPAR
ncbi:metallophosphoesterase [Candidatus Woesearchaeota archaeon]|nr:metallophosphoesterase [Candidatus Woesearchaeota archaeon]